MELKISKITNAPRHAKISFVVLRSKIDNFVYLKKMDSSLSNAIQNAMSLAKFQPVSSTQLPTTLPNNVLTVCRQLYTYVILSPLARLYLYGPSWGTFGFWSGIDATVICSQKTNLPPIFWEKHPHECVEIISKQFYGTVVMFETIFYFGTIWFILKYFLLWCTRKQFNF